MNEALIVFLAGIGGVFCGMAFLYIAIRVVSFVVSRLPDKKVEG